MPGGLVKFKSMDHLLDCSTATEADRNRRQSLTAEDLLGVSGDRSFNAPALATPTDYHSLLLEAINKTKRNSAQLRALVYERVRFKLKRDVLFGYSSLGLADLVQQIRDFELAVARIEANAIDDAPIEAPEPIKHVEPARPAQSPNVTPSTAVQVLPPTPIAPVETRLSSIEEASDFSYARHVTEIIPYRASNARYLVAGLVGIAFVGIAIAGVAFWHPLQGRQPTVVANQPPPIPVKPPEVSESTAPKEVSAPKVAFPLPASFGIYALADNKLTELKTLPIPVPDPRVAISAELKMPPTTILSDAKPAFILFRRDLLNDAPQTVFLRVIARMTRETKITNGIAKTSEIDGIWRIRNISHELRVSPIPGQPEMVIARADDNFSLAPGRYALVLNRTGFDFTVNGPAQSKEFCLEEFQTTNGDIINECRKP